ncbi:FAD-binding protein [Candidatus Woesearchaeota archaeon]|nr:FAD-binding protein [Candidatus Woesearchaeota archaeon]
MQNFPSESEQNSQIENNTLNSMPAIKNGSSDIKPAIEETSTIQTNLTHELYDIILVGAGPAGLFAAYELIKICKQKGIKKRILLIEKGKSIEHRPKSEVMCGVGGAGTFSDGKLHFTPVLSHEKIFHLYEPHECQEYLDYVDKIFTEFGVNAPYYPKNMDEVNYYVNECKKNSIQLFVRKTRHVGSDVLPSIIKNFQDYLTSEDIELRCETEVTDIIVEDNSCKGVIINGTGEKIYAKKVMLAPGRYNARWLQKVCSKYNISFSYEKVEVGVRVEFPSIIMKKYADAMYEAIFRVHTKTFDDPIRTFCPCPRGKVATEEYDGFICVNGHSDSDHASENSNFAFVTEIELTEPVENTTLYGKSIALLSTTIGGGKPILQRLVDLKQGRRSTWARLKKSFITPSLMDVVPGDISMALPYRVVQNIKEGIAKLDKALPGLDGDNTLLYAPEIKFRSSKVNTNKYFESLDVKNLFMTGDGAGVAGNIVGAAATGIIAAKGMMNGDD